MKRNNSSAFASITPFQFYCQAVLPVHVLEDVVPRRTFILALYAECPTHEQPQSTIESPLSLVCWSPHR